MQEPCGVMMWLAENIQACLRIFRRAQHQWLVRDICIKRKGFLLFLSCSQIEVQEFKGFKRFKSVLFVYSVVEKRLPEDRDSIAPLRLRGGR